MNIRIDHGLAKCVLNEIIGHFKCCRQNVENEFELPLELKIIMHFI